MNNALTTHISMKKKVTDNIISNKSNDIKPPGSKKGFSYYLKRDFFLYLMLLFPIAYILIFKYGSMYGVLIAFKDYNIFKGINESPWNNFATFKEIFKMKDFYTAVRNTLMLNGLDLIAGFPAPILLALMINEVVSVKFKKISQTILYLPHFLSWVIIGGIVTQMFASTGMVNSVIKSIGFAAVPFLSENWHWLFTYIIIGVWQSAGWGTILYLAAISGIDRQLYEAADVDGASKLKKIWHITLPGMKPTILILLILQLGRIMSIGFDRPYILANTLVMDFGDVISTYVYRIGIQAGNFSVGAAVGLFQSVICMIFVVAANYITEKSGEQGIW
jgi:putative aldouronate transport system permease protein